MRAWTRARQSTLCGQCRFRVIARGEAMLVITVPGVRRRFARCQGCVGVAPPDLPALVEAGVPAVKPFAHIMTGASALPFDVKLAAVGEREPGSDDE